MPTLHRVVTWDEDNDLCLPDDKVIAVWRCSAKDLAMNHRGVWENARDQSTAAGLEEEYTVDEFISEYRVFPNHFCAPGGMFTIEGEVTWSGGAPDRRLL